jgi:hypothetical protein
MGGAVKSVLSSPASLVGSVLGEVPIVGPVLGPAASIAMGGNPFTAIGGGIYNAATGGFGSGGGGGSSGTPSPGGGSTSPYVVPDFNYGANTYTLGGNPYDASKYFITGDKGVYNMVPELGNLYGNKTTDQLPGSTSYNIYNSIYNKMADDAKAQQAFAQTYGLQSYTPTFGSSQNRFPMGNRLSNFTGPDYLRGDVQNAYREQIKDYRTANKGIPRDQRPAFAPTPIQYADFGFSKTATMDNPMEAFANYATEQQNPFFVPFAPTTPTSASNQDTRGPAPRDIVPESVATSGSYRPVEASNTATTQTAGPAPGVFKPVNIRTGGLASLRRK